MSDVRIGYVGLGNMGIHMCANLGKYAAANGLPPLTVWNRSPDKYEQLSKEDVPNAHFAKSLEDLAPRCDLIFGCLLNDAVAQETYEKLFKTAKAGTIFADQSSLNPKTSAKLEAQAKETGLIYLSTPIFGPPPVAKSAQLLLVVSGDAKAREFIKPIIKPAIGKSIIDVGDNVMKATTLKLLGNLCILGTIELLAEAFALSDSVDFDPAIFYDFIQQWFPAPSWIGYGGKISKSDFAAGQGFRVGGGLKDGGHVLSLGEDLGHPCEVPVIEKAVENLKRAQELGYGELDWSALAIVQREKAGLPLFREGKEPK